MPSRISIPVTLGLLLFAVSFVVSSQIQEGKHPKITYGDQTVDPLADLKITYKSKIRQVTPYEFTDGPRYFLLLDDEVVEYELEYRSQHRQWSDRVLLEKLYFCVLFGTSGLPKLSDAPKEVQKLESAEGWEILDRDSDYCKWEGIVCDEYGNVSDIRLGNFNLGGTIPEDLGYLSTLVNLDLRGNTLHGTIPESLGRLKNLKLLCLAGNNLEGTLPSKLYHMTSLEQIWLSNNRLTGTISEKLLDKWSAIRLLDFSNNNFKGKIPLFAGRKNPHLVNVFLERNSFTGPLPEDTEGFNLLQVIDAGHNQLSGTIPVAWMGLPKLRDFNVAGNRMTGTIPEQILQLTSLEYLFLSSNGFSGTIPKGGGDLSWSNLKHLSQLMMNHNFLSGTFPPELCLGLSESLVGLDIGNNTLWGPIPKEIGKLTKLQRIDAQGNSFTGTLPVEMNRMDPNLELNLTGNLLIGTVPKMFCGGGAMSVSLLYRQFGCDAILCPEGTFHPYGAATLQAACRPCPYNKEDALHDPPMHKILGRTKCKGTTFIQGDLDGDGLLSPREALRLLYVFTIGRNWGAQFQTWADTNINECDLNGVTCVNGAVAKIDLTDAALCTNGERKMGPIGDCLGIPSELAILTNLEVLSLNRRQFLRGTLPTELGLLTRLKYLDISSCPLMTGTLPSELGRLTNLKFLNLGGCRFSGVIPVELFYLTNLEKFHLSMNSLSGTIPPRIGKLRKLKELMFSRTQVSGELPNEIGNLVAIENLEMYGNRFTGTIPASLGNCTNLKRVDLFNNKFTGTIPESLTRLQSLQILHVKLNRLTGTISPKFGELPFLSWFDVSSNQLYGTIPASFGGSRSMKDFRVGGNMIYAPIPQSLCSNTNINGGLTRMYGCDGVICPLGTYSDPGHATHSEGCKPCPEGLTTMYLGSSTCDEYTEKDILSIFFDVMGVDRMEGVADSNQNSGNGVCAWDGISCDSNGEISSIRFPLRDLEDTGFFND